MQPSFYRTDANRETCLLATRGRKYIHLVRITSAGLRVARVPLSEEKWITPIPNYPLERFCAKYLDVGSRLGMSDSAKRLLEGGTVREEEYDDEESNATAA